MILYTGKILQIYDWTELPIDNDFIEQVKQLSSDKISPIVKYKYLIFEWAPGIPIIYETQKEALYMIDGNEVYIEDVEINFDDNVQEEDGDEQGLNIIKEKQEPVNGKVIYITKEEDNNEVDNEDDNLTNVKHDGIRAAEENHLGKDAIKNDYCEQSAEN